MAKSIAEATKPIDDISLTTIRRQLNELRRQVRQLDRPALEECLSLAVALTNPKTLKS